MNEFVNQCREEWSRLGVPESLANEMAAELAADLQDAEAEDVTAEEYLGGSAADPSSFARSWAAERGVIPSQGSAARRKPRFLLAFTALSGVVVIVTTLLLATGQPKLSLIATRRTAEGIVQSHQVVPPVNASAPIEWILLVVALAGLAFAAWLWSSWRQSGRSLTAA